MKLSKIKTDADAVAAIHADVGERPRVELTIKDGTITGLRVGQLHATVESYNVLSVHREVAHEEAERYKLVAKAKGFPPAVRYFEYAHERSTAMGEYADGTEFEESDGVAVALADDGSVLREIGEGQPAASPTPDSDLPF